MMRRDLEVERATWIAEADGPVDREERERSDFLRYRDAKHRVADFHASGTGWGPS